MAIPAANSSRNCGTGCRSAAWSAGASGCRSGAREAYRALPIPQREDAVLHGQRGQGLSIHCFGCGAHGDVVGFVMRSEGLPFPEAVERLAREAGMEVPRQIAGGAAQGREAGDPPWRAGSGGEVVRAAMLRGNVGRAGHGILQAPRPARRDHRPLPPGLRARRPQRAAGSPEEAGHLRGSADRSRAAGEAARRRPQRLRLFPRPGDVSRSPTGAAG